MPAIDLNADLGEGLGPWRAADDVALLDIVSSANVACGFHAGDPTIMRRTCRAAHDRGVRIGAHVGYPDLTGFGRRPMGLTDEEIHDAVVVQLGALAAAAASTGGKVAYVKPHGALYHRVAHEGAAAEALVTATRAVDSSLVVLGPPGSAVVAAAERQGMPRATEGFADRAYRADGTLAPRDSAGALLTGPAAARQAVGLARDGEIQAACGAVIRLRVRSICVHGDSPDAIRLAGTVRAALREAGLSIAPFA